MKTAEWNCLDEETETAGSRHSPYCTFRVFLRPRASHSLRLIYLLKPCDYLPPGLTLSKTGNVHVKVRRVRATTVAMEKQ
jgi:hypothetical protein